jgi:enamine deaminase RidA (YjgF/YER057c/UK114 family)
MATPCLSGTSASPPSGRQTLLEIRHAATAVCWLSTAAILRQPSILRNLICPLATRLKSKVKSSPGFTDQPKVINGCSDLMVEVFGEAIGKHARSAVGMAELPFNIPVEVEMIVEVEPR